MESIYLKTFVEVVRTGNVSRAAETLCVSQPAVSKRLKFLEEQYGHPLIVRTGQSLTLTEAGRIVLQKAEKLLEIERELLAGLNGLVGKRRLSFTCTPTFGTVHLPAILREYMLECAESTDLTFAFNMPDTIIRGMQDGLFDCAVVEFCDCLRLDDLTITPLPGDEMVFLSAPAHSIPTPYASMDDLLKQALITRREGCCSRTLLENNLKGIGRDIREFGRIVVFDDLHLIIGSLVEGTGISFLSRELVERELKSGQLVEHRIDGFMHQRNRFLISTSPDRACCSNVARFIALILAHFDTPASSGTISGKDEPSLLPG